MISISSDRLISRSRVNIRVSLVNSSRCRVLVFCFCSLMLNSLM